MDVFESEEDTTDTEVLDGSAEASDPGVADDPPSASAEATAAESHVHEVADFEGSKLSKLAALRVVYGPRFPT